MPFTNLFNLIFLLQQFFIFQKNKISNTTFKLRPVLFWPIPHRLPPPPWGVDTPRPCPPQTILDMPMILQSMFNLSIFLHLCMQFSVKKYIQISKWYTQLSLSKHEISRVIKFSTYSVCFVTGRVLFCENIQPLPLHILFAIIQY